MMDCPQELDGVFNSQNTFRIVCHSVGSVFALKIAEKLEAQGKEGKIVFVDGSPQSAAYMGRGLFDADSYETIENNLLFTIIGHYVQPDDIEKVKEILSTSQNYDEKVEKLFEILPVDKHRYRPHFPTYVRSAIMRSYALKLFQTPRKSVRAECMFCKAANSHIPANALPEDYGLSDFLQKPLKVVSFDGNHVTVLENPELAKCINEFLL